MRLQKLIWVFLCLTVGGCGSYKPLSSKKQTADITSVLVISNVKESGLRLDLDGSSTTGWGIFFFGVTGGAIGAFLDSESRDIENQKNFPALQTLRERFDVGSANRNIQAGISGALSKINWTRVGTFKEFYDPVFNDISLVEHSQNSKEPTLYLEAEYKFLPQFEAMTITITYSLFDSAFPSSNPQGEELTGARKGDYLKTIRYEKRKHLIYTNQIEFQSRIFPQSPLRRLTKAEIAQKTEQISEYYDNLLQDVSKKASRQSLKRERQQAIMALNQVKVPVNPELVAGEPWLENNSELLSQTMEQGIEELSRMLVMDLNSVSMEPIAVEFKEDGVPYMRAPSVLDEREIVRVEDGIYPGKLVSKLKGAPYL